MGKRFDILLFPGGKNKAFTLSYDDGVVQDRRLVELFDYHHAKCTFNLNYGVLELKRNMRDVDISTIGKDEVRTLYKNHEVGGHGLYHSDISSLKSPYALYEIVEDKAKLEALAGYPLKMFAYPFGFFSEEMKDLLKKAGYKGARTIRSTYSFSLPKDPLELDPTCHHNDEKLMDLAKHFVEDRNIQPYLFYVWGHGYEFDKDDNWDRMEKLLIYLRSNEEKIWFATNGEILDYMQAYRMLEYSTDGSMICNPSAIDVDIMTSFGQTEHLPAGKVTNIKETEL